MKYRKDCLCGQFHYSCDIDLDHEAIKKLKEVL